MVTDKNGVELFIGDRVRVYQDEETSEAIVVEPFFDNPTTNEPGWWVDIDKGDGVEGMPSYILEKLPSL